MSPWPTAPDYAETPPSGSGLTPEEIEARASPAGTPDLYAGAYRKRRGRSFNRERQRADLSSIENQSAEL